MRLGFPNGTNEVDLKAAKSESCTSTGSDEVVRFRTRLVREPRIMSIYIVNFLRIHPESESSRRWERKINKIGCSVPTNKSRKIPA